MMFGSECSVVSMMFGKMKLSPYNVWCGSLYLIYVDGPAVQCCVNLLYEEIYTVNI